MLYAAYDRLEQNLTLGADYSIGKLGGELTFSAGANRSRRHIESRHPNSLETEMFSALPHGGSEPWADRAKLKESRIAYNQSSQLARWGRNTPDIFR